MCAFLGVLLGTVEASLLGNVLIGKGVVRAGDGVTRAEQDFLISSSSFD